MKTVIGIIGTMLAEWNRTDLITLLIGVNDFSWAEILLNVYQQRRAIDRNSQSSSADIFLLSDADVYNAGNYRYWSSSMMSPGAVKMDAAAFRY
ncbi:MAG: hypothetical protein WC959_12810 [Kiritimatiellales bacterium]